MAAAGSDPWPRLQEAALSAFSPQIDRNAPALVRAISEAVRYAEIVESRKAILLDRRAVLLGIMNVGLRDAAVQRYVNTAAWFAAWIQSRVPSDRYASVLTTAMTEPGTLVAAFNQGYDVVRSVSMDRILTAAAEIAAKTLHSSVAALRHVFAAMATQPTFGAGNPKDLDWLPTANELKDFKVDLLGRLTASHHPDEDLDAWRAILVPEQAGPPTPPAADEPLGPSAVVIPGFSSDRPPAADGRDPLGIDADVQAFARLICLEEATPPLSIAVFGGWGSGKSTFMERLESAVDRLAETERAQRDAATKSAERGETAPPPKRRFVADVIQIRFNAWHFADANLWASLSAEFFNQLRSGGYAKRGYEIHARLVEKVNAHVHSLSTAVAATRNAVAQGDREVAAAQKARDAAVKAVYDDKVEKLSQSLVDAIGSAYEQRKGDLVALGLSPGDDVERDVAEFFKAASDAKTFLGQLRIVGRFLMQRPWRAVIPLAFAAALFVVLKIGLGLGAGVVTLAATLAATATALSPVIRTIRSIVASTAAFADKLDKVSEGKTKEVVTREAELRARTQEADARREADERATRALARYIDPQSTTNPQRLLRFVLEDDPDTRALEKEIGLISRARRLFEAVDTIVKADREARAKNEPVEAAVPDRIVLYIDDLDRCTHDQVYAVLQAIHLLLAFELFIVVVGVDVRWIQESLARNAESANAGIDGRTGPEAELARRRLAITYLEKIIQVPFWLRPLSVDERFNSYGNYVKDLLASRGETSLPDRTASARTNGAGREEPTSTGAATATATRAAAPAAPDVTPAVRAATVEEAFETMTLSPPEVEFLASPAIGQLAANEPRGVKRLINVYRIARSRMSAADREALLGAGGRPPTYPIVALLAAVETGQPVEVADALYECLNAAKPASGAVVSEKVLKLSAPLRAAFDAVAGARNGEPVKLEEWAPIARVLRRYSFNRNQ